MAAPAIVMNAMQSPNFFLPMFAKSLFFTQPTGATSTIRGQKLASRWCLDQRVFSLAMTKSYACLEHMSMQGNPYVSDRPLMAQITRSSVTGSDAQ